MQPTNYNLSCFRGWERELTQELTRNIYINFEHRSRHASCTHLQARSQELQRGLRFNVDRALASEASTLGKERGRQGPLGVEGKSEAPEFAYIHIYIKPQK